MNESDLIQGAIRKDEQAWEALVNEHQQPVFRLAYLFTGDPDEAEDVTQEAFIRAFQSISKFDPERPFRPWVLSIAANLARNRQRGLKRYLGALQRIIGFEAQPDVKLLHDNEQPWEAKTLWQTVRRMSLDDQQVIYLRYFLELSEEETAGALGIPVGTIKSRLHRALKRLRVRLDQDEPDFDEVGTHE
ncbi:MAG: RNA polymerase sigma factor [Anaerolineaceae bacterium]|nr:RNA polymerase sigma factor [Anaerolineaceae bacterium]